MFWPMCSSKISVTTTAFQPDHQECGLRTSVTDILHTTTENEKEKLLRMEIRLDNCHEGLGSELVRTLSQHVGIALRSVQLTYFKNKSVKSISKFPLWSHLEIKILCSQSGRKLQNEARLLYFTCFISSRRSQLLPENNILVSTYYLPLAFSWRSSSVFTTQKIHFETLKAFGSISICTSLI